MSKVKSVAFIDVAESTSDSLKIARGGKAFSFYVAATSDGKPTVSRVHKGQTNLSKMQNQ